MLFLISFKRYLSEKMTVPNNFWWKNNYCMKYRLKVEDNKSNKETEINRK